MKKKIVVTDDDPSIQDIFRLILEREGYDVQIIPSGKDVFNNKFIIPDLFVLYKQLSGVDGLDVCRHLKSQKRTRHIPVIMVSANPGIARLALGAGADDYLEKPFNIKTLVEKVQALIQVPS